MYMIIYIYLTTFKTKGKKSTVAKDLLKQNDKIHFTGKNNTVVNFNCKLLKFRFTAKLIVKLDITIFLMN